MANRPAGIRKLVAKLQQLRPTLVAAESTGGYERALFEALQAAGLPVALVNPWRVRRFGEGLIEADNEKRELADRLQTAPCVGPGIARTLIAELPELGTLGRRQVAALVGVAPFARDSGREQGMRWIRAGRAEPRTALYLATMNGRRFNPCFRRFYQRLRDAGKPPKLALIALARKLLTILNAMVGDRTDWQQKTA